MAFVGNSIETLLAFGAAALLISPAVVRASEDYTIPMAGASWAATIETDPGNGFAIELKNASLTIEGFGSLGCSDCSMIVVSDSSVLNVAESHFEGTTLANTAAIDTGPLGASLTPLNRARDVEINVSNSTFTGNGRSILTRSVEGTSRLNVDNSHFHGNSAWSIEYRVGAGDHEMTVADSILEWDSNSPVRLYAFNNTDSSQVTRYVVKIDRSRFMLSNTALAALVMGGVEDASHPDSSWDLEVTNTIFDLRSASAGLDAAALNALPETFRRGSAIFRHNTIVLGNSQHSGVRWRGGAANEFTILNSIIDGPGTALKNEGTGSIVSGVNLYNTETITIGSVTASGDEITGVDPLFVDRAAGDFRLDESSPAVGVGEDLGIPTDIDGNPRPSPPGSNPDLGAFESEGVVPVIPGDINGDGIVNVADVTVLAGLLAANNPPSEDVGDLNGDGVVDEQDLEALARLIVDQPTD